MTDDRTTDRVCSALATPAAFEIGRQPLKGLRCSEYQMALAVLPARSPGVGQATQKAQARGEA